jgi:NAD(P)-dependent dehydrogenase (short-subunit alcohol dehydrogenase family)
MVLAQKPCAILKEEIMAIIDLKGKVALVTGSARRVGKSIALALAAQGMHQVIHHRQSEREAEETAEEIRLRGVQAEIIQADMSKPDDIQHLFDTICQRFGRLDVLVNSASNFLLGNILEMTLEQWHQSLDVNLTGPFLCSQHAARLMRTNDSGGAIINILDLSAYKVWKSYPAHSVSKAGLAALTDVLALSLGPDIRVNAIAPGPVLRDESNSPDKWEQIGKRLPLGHTGDPDDVAQAVVFLATQPFLTGTVIRVDGGEHLR